MQAYTVAKPALNAMSRQIAVEYAVDGARSDPVVIGYLLSETGPLAGVDAHPVGGPALRTATLTPPGTPEDIADATLSLVSNSSQYITDSALRVDGGPSSTDPSWSARGSWSLAAARRWPATRCWPGHDLTETGSSNVALNWLFVTAGLALREDAG